MRVLAVDLGARRVGVAVSDDEARVALPHSTLPGGPGAVRAVAALAREVGAGRIVIGLPVSMDGAERSAARAARGVATQLARETGLDVELFDERLTTIAAERALREAGLDGRERRRVVDETAATLLLQTYLDARARTNGGAR